MRHLLKLILPASILAAGFFFNATRIWAVPEFARKTKKECSFCHPPDSWNLTEAGKYYREHKYSLEGYKPKTPEKGKR
jgi:hypothetical protein